MDIPRGREDIARLFQNSTANGRVSQAYIIHAPSGMGKKTITEYVLSLLVCSTHTSCGTCSSCQSFAAHCHPDVVYLKKEEDKASLGVENVRAIKNEVYTRPVMADYKAVVAFDMHLATPGAQNAMLKMIEEPPKNVVFFLLCDTLAPILPTIVSRCVVINLNPLGTSSLMAIDGADDFLVSVSGGNPGKLKLLIGDSEYHDFRDEVTDAFFSVTADDPYSPYLAAQRLEKLKTRANEALEVMLLCARDAYFFKAGLNDRIINKDKINYIKSYASPLKEASLWKIMQNIIDTIAQKGANGNFSMALTVLLLKCRSEMKQ